MERNGQAMNLYAAMDAVEDRKEALWTAWTEYRDFECALRLALQEVEARKLEDPGLNVSVPYHLGRLEGYVELFEQLFRARERESAVRNEPDLKSEKVRQILRALYEAGELCHGELAAAVGSSNSALTNSMKKVLLSGAVESTRAGRNTRYHLTEAGRRYCEQELLGEARSLERIYQKAYMSAYKDALQLKEVRAEAQPPDAGDIPSQHLKVGDQFLMKMGNEIRYPVKVEAVGSELMGVKYAEFCCSLENAENEDDFLSAVLAPAGLGLREEA